MKTKIAAAKNNHAFDKEFVKHDVELHVDGKSNLIEVYSNDWVTSYMVVKIKGFSRFALEKIGSERAFR